ncbi:hypothetical protein AVEN_121947-1 [Araneus ventricosus]|uniref:Uncharacterized protein n=1 Tax=Araneus ventricosus TaxID=182803 RepID=A0A4Y2TMB6_ARAVE|nr:hypothetical protein AVEN_121947-1 [Araneus ventricosus]
MRSFHHNCGILTKFEGSLPKRNLPWHVNIKNRKRNKPHGRILVRKIVQWVHGESNPASRIKNKWRTMRYLTNISETRSTGITKITALAQISNTCRQQITNNNNNGVNNSAQRLTADQLAMRSRLQRD